MSYWHLGGRLVSPAPADARHATPPLAPAAPNGALASAARDAEARQETVAASAPAQLSPAPPAAHQPAHPAEPAAAHAGGTPPPAAHPASPADRPMTREYSRDEMITCARQLCASLDAAAPAAAPAANPSAGAAVGGGSASAGGDTQPPVRPASCSDGGLEPVETRACAVRFRADTSSPTRERGVSSGRADGDAAVGDNCAEFAENSDERGRASSEERGRVRAVFGERWEDAHARLVRAHAESENGGAPPPGFGYRILPCLVKTGEGLLQEQFAIQLVRMFQDVYDAARLPLSLHAYAVVATAHEAGYVELVTDAASIDSLKRRNGSSSLSELFERTYGPRGARRRERAARHFVASSAAWAVVCYLLQVKDRHNGNILLHADGYIVHIDFGFLLSTSPGAIARCGPVRYCLGRRRV